MAKIARSAGLRHAVNRVWSVAALAAAVVLAGVGFASGTYAAGGSDSSCYALMADAFAAGKLQPTSTLATKVPWPDGPKTFAPGGFVPSQSDPSAAAPVCAPGFSLLLAPAVRLGGPNGLFAVTPIAAALLVWCAFLAGRALGGPLAGALAAVLTATSPIVLFQAVQPMNDITTAMFWMAVFAALTSRRWGLAGVCCGLALLVRPNLLPLAIVAGLFVGLADRHGPGESPAIRLVLFGAGALPCVLLVLWLNHALYGGPLRSGYGQLGDLFSVGHIWTNMARYARWLVQTQTLFIGLAIFAPLAVERKRRPDVWLALGLTAATVVIYLLYTPFDDWSYLRFLLPGICLLVVLMSVVLIWVAEQVGGLSQPAWMYPILAMAALGLAVNGVAVARSHLAFQMRALEQRYRSSAIVVRDRLPPDAAVLTTWDSGAVRFHARKEAIVWDALDPAWLDGALAWLSAQGFAPFILVESWEEPRFRARFAGVSEIGRLDWPPRYEVDRVVRIYDPKDRARYLRGEKVVTDYVWPLLSR